MISRKARHRFKANCEGHMSLTIEQRPRPADGEEKVEPIQSEGAVLPEKAPAGDLARGAGRTRKSPLSPAFQSIRSRAKCHLPRQAVHCSETSSR